MLSKKVSDLMLIEQHVGNALLNRVLAIALAAHEGALLHVHLEKAPEIREFA